MSRINQAGEEVQEWTFYTHNADDLTDDEVKQAVVMLADQLGMTFVRTNATKHGNTELQLRKDE